jgi:5'-nucleotidase
MELRIDTDMNKVLSENWSCLPIDETHCPRDEALEALILNYKTETDKKYGRIITRFARPLTHPTRIAETELGNLFADLMQVDSSFDIMLYGSGSIRRDALGPILRYQDLLESTPYDDPIYMVEVTGGQLRRMILYVLRDEAYEGHTEFYQYSKGVKIVYAKSKHALESFSLNGEEIRDDKYYKIGLQNYHFKNFDDFFSVPIKEIEKNKKPRIVATSCFCILEELLTNAKNVDSKIEGRLVIKD